MKGLETIRSELAAGLYDLSRHALGRVVERNISAFEIREAGQFAEMLEQYPDDKYGPSALLFGKTSVGRPLHFQVSLKEVVRTKIITLYEPDPAIWLQFRIRR